MGDFTGFWHGLDSLSLEVSLSIFPFLGVQPTRPVSEYKMETRHSVSASVHGCSGVVQFVSSRAAARASSLVGSRDRTDLSRSVF